MVPGMVIEPGLSAKLDLTVTENDTAIAIGSGNVPVLATPRLIALCEQAAVAALVDHLEPGDTSVAMKVQFDHLAPSAVGQKVCAEATVEKVSGRRVVFTVSVNDERGLVAVGRVTRVVVNSERFLEKTTS